MKKRSYFLLFLSVGIIGAFFVYNYLYKDHRDISNEKAAFVLTSNQMTQEFSKDSETSTAKYLDKTIEISGKITEIEKDNFLLGSSISCYTDSLTILSLSINKEVSVKGRFIGYDELLENIKLDQVSIVK